MNEDEFTEFSTSLGYYGGVLREITSEIPDAFAAPEIKCEISFYSPEDFHSWVDFHNHYYGTGSKSADLREEHPELKRAWLEYLVLEKLYGG